MRWSAARESSRETADASPAEDTRTQNQHARESCPFLAAPSSIWSFHRSCAVSGPLGQDRCRTLHDAVVADFATLPRAVTSYSVRDYIPGTPESKVFTSASNLS